MSADAEITNQNETTELIEPNEPMVQIPVRQYAEAVMAMQKLNDIKKVAFANHYDKYEACLMLVRAIREIVKEQDGGNIL